MKILISILAILVINFSCKTQDSKLFLSRFHTVDSVPKKLAECYMSFDSVNRIEHRDLNRFLISTNDFGGALDSQDNKFYYGFKYQLNKNLYIVSITKSYLTLGNFSFTLFKQFDIQLYIYDAEKNSFISTLVVFSSDPISRRFQYINGMFEIFVSEAYFNVNDEPESKITREIVSSKEKYVINSDGLFERTAVEKLP